MSDALISKLDVAAFKSNPKYYPPAKTLCPNGTMGCENSCENSEACTNRETAGKDCLVIAMMKPDWDKAYFQAVVSNIGIPAYFCFIGYDGVNKYASDAADSKTPVMFIHWEPDMFHVTHKGLFDRIFLPRTDPARVKLATGDYGENGYGKKTNNRWTWTIRLWKSPNHIISQVIGCDNDSTVRSIQFTWSSPNPGNATLPYNCDGGIDALPETIETSRSCDWISENRRVWTGWVDAEPACDSSFYDYKVSECDSNAHRTVTYFWLLPYAPNPEFSVECSGGSNLPEDVQIDCEYMPTSSPTFAALAVLALIVVVLLAAAIVVVFKQRDAPVIRRSQFEMLLWMLFGGFFVMGAIIAYAGRPSRFLCGIRPVLICMGFTTIFGALVIKSLRVYRVFMRSDMKRVRVTLLRILKFLSIFYVGDIVIFMAWFAAAFPEPTITTEVATEFRGTVDRISCSSSSFIFTALLIFWKAILLVLGLYLSFLIRNVSTDFQESPWIFGSVVVALIGCVLILPMSYLVSMRASTFYVFLALALIICTISIMCLMLVPKLFRLKEAAMSSTSGTSTASSMKSRTSMAPASTILTNIADGEKKIPRDASRKTSQKYMHQVQPLANKNVANPYFSTINDEVTSTTNAL
ncbi:hypothetical protein PF010_g20410 [Phytophthora fragariae]|nr:hypothetical protein PF003_g26051 [Phytophthora fragariae]KAE8986869.1 hypothetical protein PF011_g19816 [Phytophthora fragariae]KAE9085574.1 hypothetical protein PF010_g20410 [Phytophthora fragariae]KAE9112048.1 hypothetical protein PF006_g20072 [Phytophthora fragariae]KAE9191923.1 hypothetical protein PF004_g21462 [Phytophthora fragariae]